MFVKNCNNTERGPVDPFFDDIMPTTRGLGYQGGVIVDGAAKIEQDTRERKSVSVAAFI